MAAGIGESARFTRGDGMKAGICCVAALMGAMGMGIAGEVAAESNSSPALLTGRQVTVMERQKARPDPEDTIDLPPAPPQDRPMMVAQADQALQQAAAKENIMGVCHPVPNAIAPEGARVEYVIAPNFSAQYYFSQYEHIKVQGAATVTVLQGPKHGVLLPVTAENAASIGPSRYVEGSNLYAYFPDKGYIGKDRATLLVNFGGQKVKVVYFFQSLDHPLGNTGGNDACEKTGYQWKISQDSNGNPVLTAK